MMGWPCGQHSVVRSESWRRNLLESGKLEDVDGDEMITLNIYLGKIAGMGDESYQLMITAKEICRAFGYKLIMRNWAVGETVTKP